MIVGIVAQKDNGRAVSLAATLSETLQEVPVDVVVDETTARAFRSLAHWEGPDGLPARGSGSVPIDELETCDLVVSIGGDGTFLYAARGAGKTPLMGVNLGEVGFLNAIAPENAVETVRAAAETLIAEGEVRTRELARLEARGDGWSLSPALNEVVVLGPRRGRGGGLSVEVRVDGRLYTGGAADGVLIATPTGSTAYNLSEGGPLLHPDVDGFVVSELAGADAMPPLVIDRDSDVTVRIDDAETGTVVGDGSVRQDVTPPTQVTIARANEPVRIAGPPVDFFTALGKLE